MVTPAPHPIDTDALRKLCEAAPDEGIQIIPSSDKTSWERCISARDFFVAARNALPTILDELDRLRAAEAAGEARDLQQERDAQRYRKLRSIGAAPNGTKQLSDGLVLVAQILDEWIDLKWPLGDELRTHAVLQGAARAEIARLTDAGAVATSVGIVPVHTDYSVYPNKTIFALAETNAFVGNALRREAFREAARVAETYKFGLTQMGDARAAAIATKLYALAEESKP